MGTAARALLRTCRKADQSPASIVALLGRPHRIFDAERQRIERMPPGSRPFVDDAIREICGGCTEYALPQGSAVRAARRMLLCLRLLGANAEADADDLRNRLEVAFAIAEEVHAVGKAISATEVPDASAEDAGAIASQALPELDVTNATASLLSCLSLSKEMSVPAIGDLLLAHPMSGFLQSDFDQAVVLLVDVDADTKQVKGLILNKPGAGTLAEQLIERPSRLLPKENTLLLHRPSSASTWNSLAFGPLLPFLDIEIAKGGPSLGKSWEQSMSWIHINDVVVPGAFEVMPSVWLGGDLNAVASTARAATQNPESTRLHFFRGFVEWSLDQLELEVERGVWIRTRINSTEDAESAKSILKMVCFDNYSPSEKWQALLQMANLGVLSQLPRGREEDDILLHFITTHQHARAEEYIKASSRAGSQ